MRVPQQLILRMRGEEELRCADRVDPVDKGAGRGTFRAAVHHVPDKVIHIGSLRLSCKKNIVV